MSARNWCYTLNNYTEEEMMSVLHTPCRYHIFGLEVGESGTPHIQGYIEFGKVMRRSACKKLFARAHWEVRMGSREEARDYCKKEGEWEEIGIWDEGGQGARADLQGLMRALRGGTPLIQLMEDSPQVVSNNLRFVDRYIALAERADTKDFRTVEVHALIGDAGTGKTRIVHDLCPDVFTVNAGETFPFDGYNGEKEILIDDFYGGIRYSDILRILDGHQYRVNVKGGYRYAQWTQVFITSNKEPQEWYSVGLTDALKRRISDVTMFCNEEVGNTVPPLEIEI